MAARRRHLATRSSARAYANRGAVRLGGRPFGGLRPPMLRGVAGLRSKLPSRWSLTTSSGSKLFRGIRGQTEKITSSSSNPVASARLNHRPPRTSARISVTCYMPHLTKLVYVGNRPQWAQPALNLLSVFHTNSTESRSCAVPPQSARAKLETTSARGNIAMTGFIAMPGSD